MNIREFYAGKNVLLTGGTGFMGKVQCLCQFVPLCGPSAVAFMAINAKVETCPQQTPPVLRDRLFFPHSMAIRCAPFASHS
jgi:hypothetical protein